MVKSATDKQSIGRLRRPLLMIPMRTVVLQGRLSESALKVLNGVCHQRAFENDTFRMGMRAIALAAGLSDERQATKGLKQLIEIGLVTVLEPAKVGRGNHGLYRINYGGEKPGEEQVSAIGKPLQLEGFKDDEKNGRKAGRNTGRQEGFSMEYKEDRKQDQDKEQSARAGDDVDRKNANPARTDQRGQREKCTPVGRGSSNDTAALGAAIAPFDRWAMLAPPMGTGFQICKPNNDHVPVVALLVDLDAKPPIKWQGRAVAGRNLITAAVDQLINNAKPFTSIKFAVECVRRELAAWANGNLPRPKKGHPARPAAPVVYGRRFS